MKVAILYKFKCVYIITYEARKTDYIKKILLFSFFRDFVHFVIVSSEFQTLCVIQYVLPEFSFRSIFGYDMKKALVH